jgi:hypothetical protein
MLLALCFPVDYPVDYPVEKMTDQMFYNWAIDKNIKAEKNWKATPWNPLTIINPFINRIKK